MVNRGEKGHRLICGNNLEHYSRGCKREDIKELSHYQWLLGRDFNPVPPDTKHNERQ